MPDAPDVMWGTDATMGYTLDDGWVWLFAAIDHYTAEAWTHVARRGDRFAALQPVYDAVVDRFAKLGPDVARGVTTGARSTARPTSPDRSAGWGSTTHQRSSGNPKPTAAPSGSSAHLRGCLWARPYATVDELRQSVAEFTHRYNTVHRSRSGWTPDWQVTTMTVMNEHDRTQDQAEDFRSKPRWSANKKADAVLRLLRGEPLDALSRELGVGGPPAGVVAR